MRSVCVFYDAIMTKLPERPAPAGEAAPRRPRADGLRNRVALLEAARELLTDGEAADVRSIARRAGVGVGTLFRHFATRDDLVEAVLADDLERWSQDAAQAVAAAAGPYAALAAFLDATLRRQVATPGLPRLYSERWGPDTMSRVGAWYPELLERLAAGCRESGEVGVAIGAGDIDAMVVASGHLAMERPEHAPLHLRLWLDGVRA